MSTEAEIIALARAVGGDIKEINDELSGLDKLTQFGINDKSLNSVNGGDPTQNPWGKRVVNILGDSISYGANAANIRDDSYVGILRKMLNQEFGGHNYGFVSMYDKTSNEFGEFKEIHTKTGETGTISTVAGAAAGHLPNGWGITGTNGSTLSYVIPADYQFITFWYDGTATGTIEIVIGGAVVQTITANGGGNGYDCASPINLAAHLVTGTASFTIRFVNGSVAVTGFALAHVTTLFSLNNFSRDGRKGMHVAQSVIDAACRGSYFTVWALGANDRSALGEDFLAYKQRIDWLIAAATAHGTRVVILDLLFQEPDSNPIRQELRRAAESISGAVYVGLANVLTTDGHVLSPAELNELKISEGSHPEETGHRLIAEVLAKRLGLQYTSKRKAALDEVTFRAIPLSSGFTNPLTYQGGISGYRINSGSIDIILTLSAPTTLPAVIGDIPTGGKRVISRNFRSESDSAGNWFLINLNTSGRLTVLADPRVPSPPPSVRAVISIPTNDMAEWY